VLSTVPKPNVHRQYLVRFLGTTEHSCARADPPVPDLVGRFLEGLALWHSGRRGQSVWFVILVIVNTVGIVPTIYLFAVARLKVSELVSKKT
jgi:hypothetical protein